MIFSVKDLDILSSKNNQKTKNEVSIEKRLDVVENSIIKATLYKTYVEIVLKSSLKNASSVVYELNSEGEKSTIIGQLSTAGIYRFSIHKLPNKLLIYDDLKQTNITKITFKWD
tara:strand:+ start:1483 stop:1824 length:342 start_codon:yes stop_codon:yes gene_type:complete